MTDKEILESIHLELMWVQHRKDKTDRTASLYQISQMPYRQRQHLHFIKDFRDETITMVEGNATDPVKINTFTKECKRVGFIYWTNTDHCGVFYELIYVTDSEEIFDAIRSAYCNFMNP